jgi:hypothetical protein
MTHQQIVSQRVDMIESQLLRTPSLSQADCALVMELAAAVRQEIRIRPNLEPRNPAPPFSHWRMA